MTLHWKPQRLSGENPAKPLAKKDAALANEDGWRDATRFFLHNNVIVSE